MANGKKIHLLMLSASCVTFLVALPVEHRNCLKQAAFPFAKRNAAQKNQI